MATSIIERVAIAIYSQALNEPLREACLADPTWNDQWDDLNDYDREPFIETARTVMATIRNIAVDTTDDTEIDMLCRGRAVLPEHDEPLLEDAANCWAAMIDAALDAA